MPSFNPIPYVTGRNVASLFEVRLDNDFIVFRGNEHESNGQLVKGQVVLCLPQAQKMEDVRLRLTGTLRHNNPGASAKNGERNTTILQHRWTPFIGQHGKSMTLPAGNYEWPFEYILPGNTAESVEGMREASITYRLKATVGRGKLAYDLHAYRHLRVIRTLDSGDLGLHHAMSVENIWANKIDYSLVIPQKAVTFGGNVDLSMRVTPLLKGLELGKITATLVEIREITILGSTGLPLRDQRIEHSVKRWEIEASREEHWQDMIEDTGQDGWVVEKKLDLPRKLRQCIQDVNVHGLKIRHKVKLTVALKNPDGHVSELRAALPISIFISPSAPINEQGEVVVPSGAPTSAPELEGQTAPPVYGDHHLDQLYDDLAVTGFQTPAGIQTPAIHSGMSSPFYHSRAGSMENLASVAQSIQITPAALSSRLADVSSDPAQRSTAFDSQGQSTSEPHSENLTRSNSGQSHSSSGRRSLEHIDITEEEFAELNKVPSYATALRTPARSRASSTVEAVPDYQTALSQPSTPPHETPAQLGHLSTITEHQFRDFS